MTPAPVQVGEPTQVIGPPTWFWFWVHVPVASKAQAPGVIRVKAAAKGSNPVTLTMVRLPNMARLPSLVLRRRKLRESPHVPRNIFPAQYAPGRFHEGWSTEGFAMSFRKCMAMLGIACLCKFAGAAEVIPIDAPAKAASSGGTR
jgi:hypothetical protein